ncbi:MAG: agmatine deiminase family protein, partial [Myxococcales bacterium]|nr:agmatine deiminase family protein [Myxococcales bacterium]
AAAPRWRLPGDFERKRAVLLPTTDLLSSHPGLFAELVGQLDRYVHVMLATETQSVCRVVDRVLDAEGVPKDVVPTCLDARHQTMWMRDYGPLVTLDRRRPGRPLFVDAYYGDSPSLDDDVPMRLAKALHRRHYTVALLLEGGNLLSNGVGLLVTTRQLVERNVAEGLSEQRVLARLRRTFGAGRVAVLEPLSGEPTGHVDMFAAFAAPDVVLVGSFTPEQDPDNSALLDRNAAQLRRQRLPDGRPLRVVRIPMGNNIDGVWRSYTNVLFANGLLLVPTYRKAKPAVQRRALATWRATLPRWRVSGVDVSRLAPMGGTLHCISSSLPRTP